MNETQMGTIADLMLLFACFSVALAVGGGIYESMVVMPQWSAQPPASFAIIQKGTGVPLQRFWIPVHILITIGLLGSLITNWNYADRKRLIIVALISYLVMRAWSFAYFIPEMLRFQDVPLDQPPTAALLDRVRTWTRLTWFREPLDLTTQFCLLVALMRSKF
ncbi:MAG: hypothetical protein JWO48_2431 [Bryobacterales bacterium]|nr:hypothetical protein [Bryobacterales bacterium]